MKKRTNPDKNRSKRGGNGVLAIENSSLQDINEIFKLYQFAREFQKIKGAVLWQKFDKALIETEIIENRQWKITIDGQIACDYTHLWRNCKILFNCLYS